MSKKKRDTQSNRLLTTAQVARRLKRSPQWVRKRIKSGDIIGKKIGSEHPQANYFVRVADLNAFIESFNKEGEGNE